MTFSSASFIILASGFLLLVLAALPAVIRKTRDYNGHKLQAFRALRSRNFRWFWINAFAQSLGQGMQFLILGWLVLELTSSPSQLGLVVFAYGVPNMVLTIFGGIIADRMDRRMLLIITRIGVSALVLTIAALTITDYVVMWHVYLSAMLLGVLQALNMPARLALVADLVDREDIASAVGLHSAMNQTGQILGPALAGWVIEVADIGPALILNAGCYLAGVVFLVLISGLGKTSAAGNTSMLEDLLAGMHYIRSTPILLTVVGIALAFGFFGMAHRQVLPAFAQEVLEVGPGGVGLLLLGGAVGSLVGNLGVASFGSYQRKGWLLLGAVLTFSLILFLFALSQWFWVSWILFLLLGVASLGGVWPLATTIVQLTTPPEMRGRVLAALQLTPALHYIGALPTAVVASTLSWPVAIGGGAALCLAVVLWLGVWHPTLRQLRT